MQLLDIYDVVPYMDLILGENENSVVVMYLNITTTLRNTGLGTIVMQLVCQYADETKKDVYLKAGGMIDTNHTKLIPFYQRFGFVATETYNLKTIKPLEEVSMARKFKN